MNTTFVLGTVARRLLVMGMLAVAVLVGWWIPRRDVPTQFWMADVRSIRVDGQSLRLVVGDFGNGLREVPTLGGLDGMLFVFDTDRSGAFGMELVHMPLDVAWFDSDRRLIALQTMATCEGSDCVRYESPRPFCFAIETPVGRLADVAPGALMDDPGPLARLGGSRLRKRELLLELPGRSV